MTDRLIDGLRQFIPCEDAVKWIGDMTLEEVWSKCHRIDWMMWLLGHLTWQKGELVDPEGWPDHNDCLRLVVKLLTPTAKNSKRSKKDRELMEKIFRVCLDFADGKISDSDAGSSINGITKKIDNNLLRKIGFELCLLDTDDGIWGIFHDLYLEIYKSNFPKVSKGLCDFLRLHVPCGPKWW